MKKLTILIIIAFGVILAGLGYRYFSATTQPNEKIYVAVEGEGKISVVDPLTKKVVRNIDLSRDHEGGRLTYAPHNVQVSPDGKTVWVAANAASHQDHTSSIIKPARAHGEVEEVGEVDEVIVIRPSDDKIIKRVPIERNAHLTHVVLAPDSAYAYVIAQEEGAIYKISARTYEIKKRIATRKASEPHGIRVSPDGSFAYIAMLKGRALGVLNLKGDTLDEVPLEGAAVQTGVTPDRKLVVVSLYDTKKLAVYRTDTKEVSYVDLPESSKGPIQMYATPDSRFVYLADQGYYFEQPTNDKVYKIDLETMRVTKEIKAGDAPHGVMVAPDGKTVYVTNLLSGDVSIIDTSLDQEIGRIPVGKEPNGISFWQKK